MSASSKIDRWAVNWRDWKNWAVLLAIFTLFELFETFRFLISLIANGYDQSYIARALSGSLLVREFLEVYCIGVLIPLFWIVVGKIQLKDLIWWRWVPLNLALILVFVAGHQIVFRIILIVFNGLMDQPVAHGALWELNPWTLLASLSISAYFAAALGVFYGLDALHRWRSEQTVTARLSQQLALARLRALQTQIHPHFLFNTLQLIAALIPKRPAEAEQMLVMLGDLFRLILAHEQRPVVRLRDELSFVKKYLEIQKIRFADQLDVEWNISEAGLGMEVPTLILQPLVENAVEHGLTTTTHKGRLVVGSKIADGVLWLWISDNGNGLSIRKPNGIGLTNTAERLQTLYGDQGKFRLETGLDGMTTALIQLPARAQRA